MSENHQSNDEDVSKLKFPDSIRKRPGMYTDDIDTANVMFRELVDNCVDLILKKQMSLDIDARTNLNGFHLVCDTGPGLPIYKDHDYDDQPITVDLLSNTHVGSNFNRTTYSIGMNGIGSKLTNALSDYFIVYVNAKKASKHNLTPSILKSIEEGKDVFRIHFEKGILQNYTMVTRESMTDVFTDNAKFDKVPSKLVAALNELPENFGTILIFKPDLTIIAENVVDYHAYPFKLMGSMFEHDSLYNKVAVNFKLNGESISPYNFDKLYEIEDVVGKKYFNYSADIKTKEQYPIKFIGSFCYHTTKMDYESIGSVNLLRTHNGKHITIFQRALGKALHKFNPLIKIPDARYGLRSFTLSFSVEPFFEGQTKNKLGQFKDKGYNENHTIEALSNIILEQVINSNEEYFNGLCAKIIEYKRSLDRLSKKDFVLSHIEYSNGDLSKGLGMGARVFDCTNKNPNNRILYITEGKSAGGSLIKARKERLKDIAILPLRGVPLNAATSNINAIVQNNEFKSIINTLGTGLDPFIRMEKRRYAQIILSPDADPAGQFIGALLLGFFGMYLRPWIEEGRVFLALSPLYRQNGKFIFDEKELNKKKEFTRFKGLGEMNPSDIRETHIDNPRLVKITIDDVDKALKLIINASNERKALSKELGILTDKETFLEAVGDSEIEIMGNFEDALASDEEDETESSQYDEQLESEVEVA